jgi:hypothetical protein
MGLSTSRDWIEIVAIIGVCALLNALVCRAPGCAPRRAPWQEEPVSRRIAKAKAVLTRPRFATGALRRRLSRSLERNPIGWLQHYSWSGRITKWGWLAALILAESLAITDVRNFADMQPFICSDSSLRDSPSRRPQVSARSANPARSKLLLRLPLTVAQLMWGRLRGFGCNIFRALPF